MSRKGPKYPYLPWWLYDYRSDPLVQAMSDDQDLAYRRMIEVSWDLGELENNPGKIASLIQFSPRKFDSVWKYPLTECWKDNGSGLVNARLEKEWEKVEASYRQKKRAGEASAQARKKARDVERTLNGCSTDVERTLNDPDPDPDPVSKTDPDNTKQGSFLNDGRSGSSAKPDEPTTRRLQRVKWDKDEMKLKASDSFKEEFIGCWKKEFTVAEISLEVKKASRWLVKHPGRRGSRSRLDLYLHKWMENALEDRRAREEEEATMRPPPPEPERKWCRVCRATLPRHAAWCTEDLEKGDDHEGDDQEDR